MKICLISNLYPPNILGGAEVVVRNLAHSFKQNGNEVVVITSATGESDICYLDEAGVAVHQITNGNLYHLLNSKQMPAYQKIMWHGIDIWNGVVYNKVVRILKEYSPDIINTHNVFGLSPSVWTAGKVQEIPIVHTLHDYSLICPKTTLLKRDGTTCEKSCFSCSLFSFPKRRVSNCVDAIISPSKFVLSVMRARGFFQRTPHYVIPNASGATPKRHDARDNTVRFLYIGQIGKHKGVSVLINAFTKIDRGIDCELHIAGKGDDLDECRRLAADDKRIVFHGFVSGDEKDQLFSQSTALAVPSLWYENAPMVILEAYGYGVPVIASRIGGIPELVDDGKTGHLFTPGNVNDLVDKLQQFINGVNDTDRMIQLCYGKAQPFSVNRQAREYLTVFDTCVNHGQ